MQIPPGFNHPARVAERIATLDLVSGGRVEFGTGESSSQAELGGFGVDRETKRAQWEEALDAITRMFVEEPFAGYDGQFISMPPRAVVPKPKQKPHPPLWVACSRRETILLAARKGIGALTFAFIEPEQAKEWVDEYYGLIESDECVPAGFAVNPNFAVVLPMMLHKDEATAIERGIDGAHFFGFSLAHYYVFGDHRPGITNVWDEFQAKRADYGFAREIINADDGPLGVKILQQGLGSLRGAIGTPEQVTDLVERYEAAGVDQVIFVQQAGPNRHEHICESIELFGSKVLPHFADGREEREAAKRERLAQAVRAGARAARAAAHARPRLRDHADRRAAAGAGDRRRAPGGVERRSERRPALAQGAGSQRAGESAFAAFVRGRSDAQLERTVGSNAGPADDLQGDGARLRPRRRRTASPATFQYELTGRNGDRNWVVRIEDGGAPRRARRAQRPGGTFRTSVPTFARIAVRGDPPREGDPRGRHRHLRRLRGRRRACGEMFGQQD